MDSHARATRRAHNSSPIAPYITGAKHSPTDGGKVRGRMDLRVCTVGWLVGWMDGEERLGLASRVMDVQGLVMGEGQDMTSRPKRLT